MKLEGVGVVRLWDDGRLLVAEGHGVPEGEVGGGGARRSGGDREDEECAGEDREEAGHGGHLATSAPVRLTRRPCARHPRPMASAQGATVADRLRGARQRQFVGRTAELELFRGALAADEPPFSVLWLLGPGGVGKTTLVAALAEAAARAGRRPVVLDLRACEPSPPAFTAALGQACGRPGAATAADALAGRERPVLLLDTFEAAAGLEDWLRDAFVPALPAGAVTVIAGRAGPDEAWRRDAGWRDLLRVVSLRNLDADDARALLARAGVPAGAHDRVLELTYGHPLALALLVDVLALREDDDEPLDLGTVPDVVGKLVASFVAGVPSPRHRMALELAAHAHTTTAGLVHAALGDEDGEELFAWLRGLSFVESGPHGVFPHDLARAVIDTDLRWRDPPAYALVHGAVRSDVVRRLTSTEGAEHQRALADLMFLHRGNPAAPLFWDWDSLGHVYADDLRRGDDAAILAMVERHEGAASVALAAHWLERQPGAFAAFRGRGGEPVGFLAQLALHEASEDDRARDPAAQAAWAYAMRHAPPREQDEVLLARFFMDRDAYQAPSRSFNVATMRSTQAWLARRRLSWYFIGCADPDAVAPFMAYIHFHRAPEADVEAGGHRFGVFARDWRRCRGAEWLRAHGRARAGRRRVGRAAHSGRGARARAGPAGVRRRGPACPARSSPPGGAGRQPARAREGRPRARGGRCHGAARAPRRGPRGARGRSARRQARPRPRPHLRAARGHAGGGGRPARPALQHLSRAPDPRARAGLRPALAARALRAAVGQRFDKRSSGISTARPCTLPSTNDLEGATCDGWANMRWCWERAWRGCWPPGRSPRPSSA